MTDTVIEKVLTDAFLTLNEFSGVSYIKKDATGKLLNVSLPNIKFEEPPDKRYFILNFLSNEPIPAGLGLYAENRYDGFLQIDIMTPLNTAQDEANEKVKWLCRLFSRGKSFGRVTVVKTYRAFQETGMTYYRTVVRVQFSATLPKD